jgi:SAM-dependent methyltransferase
MLMNLTDMLPLLRCPLAGSGLAAHGRSLISDKGTDYPVINGIPILLPDAGHDMSALPQGYKKRERLLTKVLRRWLLVSVTQESTDAINRVIEAALANPSSTILIVGGGVVSKSLLRALESPTCRVASLDIYASDKTNLVADAHHIPFGDETFDFSFVQAVLEHVFSPWQVVSEIHRVLKPGGTVVADTPFLYPVHEGAYDFTRFTHAGHRWLFRSFEEVASGPSIGAGNAFMISAKYFFTALTRSKALGSILTAPFALARAFDRLIPRERHIDAAGGFYFIGTRTDREIPKSEVIRSYAGAQS